MLTCWTRADGRPNFPGWKFSKPYKQHKLIDALLYMVRRGIRHIDEAALQDMADRAVASLGGIISTALELHDDAESDQELLRATSDLLHEALAAMDAGVSDDEVVVVNAAVEAVPPAPADTAPAPPAAAAAVVTPAPAVANTVSAPTAAVADAVVASTAPAADADMLVDAATDAVVAPPAAADVQQRGARARAALPVVGPTIVISSDEEDAPPPTPRRVARRKKARGVSVGKCSMLCTCTWPSTNAYQQLPLRETPMTSRPASTTPSSSVEPHLRLCSLHRLRCLRLRPRAWSLLLRLRRPCLPTRRLR